MMAILMVRAFMMGASTVPFVTSMLKGDQFEHSDLIVALRNGFSGIPPLDELFEGISVAFMQMQSGADIRLYYQSFIFLAEYGSVYVILLLESTRLINKSSLFQ